MNDEADPILEAVEALRVAGVAVAPIGDDLERWQIGACLGDVRAIHAHEDAIAYLDMLIATKKLQAAQDEAARRCGGRRAAGGGRRLEQSARRRPGQRLAGPGRELREGQRQRSSDHTI
ncbi:hypothetical protein [Methylobacterium sp. 1030]|uniref:hypothetical protein n=1 Tax=Methylobacterium sp. 1030 TaxID=3156404 RepID=UPI00339AEA0E